jgi:prophage antirepressor-like protein
MPKIRGKIVKCINEEGLIELISQGQTPICKSFRRFITKLLKNIRLGKIKLLDGETLALINNNKEL